MSNSDLRFYNLLMTLALAVPYTLGAISIPTAAPDKSPLGIITLYLAIVGVIWSMTMLIHRALDVAHAWELKHGQNVSLLEIMVRGVVSMGVVTLFVVLSMYVDAGEYAQPVGFHLQRDLPYLVGIWSLYLYTLFDWWVLKQLENRMTVKQTKIDGDTENNQNIKQSKTL